MSCTAQELNQIKQQYSGGSDQRYLLTFNRKAIFSEGVKAVADAAGAYWLMDIIALQAVPLHMEQWLKGVASTSIVTIEVEKGVAKVELSIVDEAPPAFSQTGISTDFPDGKWNFYVGVDEVGPEGYISVIYLPEEH